MAVAIFGFKGLQYPYSGNDVDVGPEYGQPVSSIDKWDLKYNSNPTHPHTLEGNVCLKYNGFFVYVSISMLQMDGSANPIVPLPLAQQLNARVEVAMGSNLDRDLGRFVFGPAVLVDRPDDNPKRQHDAEFGDSAGRPLRLRFGPGGPLERAWKELITGDLRDQSANPLEIFFAKAGYADLDLKQGTLSIPKHMLAATLRSCKRPTSPPPDGPPMYLNSADIVLNFKDCVNKTSRASPRPWRIEFSMVHPGTGAPINVASTGEIGLEALGGGLEILLGPAASPNTSGAQVIGAQLQPDGANPLVLRFKGLRNSLNEPEVWSLKQSEVRGAPNVVGLAFRSPSAAAASSALLYVDDIGGWTRQRDYLDPAAQPQDLVRLPMHSRIANAQIRLTDASSAKLFSKVGATPAASAAAWCDTTLQQGLTRPWFRFTDATFAHTRPGDSYQGSGDGVEWMFSPNPGKAKAVSGGAPLLPSKVWLDLAPGKDARNDPREAADKAIDRSFIGMALAPARAVHETGFVDATDQPSVAPTITKIMPRPDQVGAALRLSRHTRVLQLAAPAAPAASPVTFSTNVEVRPDAAPEYAVLWPGAPWKIAPAPLITDIQSWADALAGRLDPDFPVKVGAVAAPASSSTPIAVLKLSRRQSIEDILLQMEQALANPGAFHDWRNRTRGLIQAVDPAVLSLPAWVGLVVFDAPLDFGEFPVLQALAPTEGPDAPRLNFLAVSPQDPKDPHASPVSVSGAVEWMNSPTKANYDTDIQEANLQPLRLSIAVRDRKLIKFESESQLEFRRFMGVGGSLAGKEARTPIKIVGSVRDLGEGQVRAGNGQATGKDDQKTSSAYEIRFMAEIPDGDGLVLYPVGGSTPDNQDASFIQKVSLSRVEVVDGPPPASTADRTKSKRAATDSKAEVQIDGSIVLRKPSIPGVDVDPSALTPADGIGAKFANLRISLAPIKGLLPRLLSLNYPSLSFDLDLPHLNLLGGALQLKFHQLAMDWGAVGDTQSGIDWAGFSSIGRLGAGTLDLTLPKIAFLGRLDFGALPDLFARSLSGFSLETVFVLYFDVKQARLTGGQYFGIRGFGFNGLDLDLASFLEVKIKSLTLGRKSWKNPSADGAVLAVDGVQVLVLKQQILPTGSGAYFSLNGNGGDGFWAVLEGSAGGLFNVHWGFAAHNVELSTSAAKSLLAPPPQQAQFDSSGYAGIGKTLTADWVSGDLRPALSGAGRGWTFAASLEALFGTFQGSALIQDSGYKGLALWGQGLKDLLGYQFAFVGNYCKDITPGEDYFYFSVTLPGLTMGGVRFTGGEIAAEIYTSGDFMADFGFPWPAPGGGRLWDRTLGAIVTPGQASGGMYVRKRQFHTGDENGLTIAGGVALQWGLGASFGGVTFVVWVRIGVYMVLEGEVTLAFTPSAGVTKLVVAGAAGVMAEGYGELNWWIIDIRVDVLASAEIHTVLTWTAADHKAQVLIAADMSVSAHAEACIGGSCFRVCRGISVSVDVPVHQTLELG